MDRTLWAAGFCGHLLLLGVLFGKGRARQFPAFTTLITANVFRTLLLFFLQQKGSRHAYTSFYLLADGLDPLFELLVVFEVARQVFRPLGRWAPEARQRLPLMVLLSLVLAAGLTCMGAPSSADWRFNLFGKVNFFTACLLSELFLSLIALSVTSGLPWKTHLARVAQGLGVYSLVNVLVEAGQTMAGSLSGERTSLVLTETRKVVYLLCVGFWIVTLWQEAPEPRRMPASLEKHLHDLQTRLAYDLFTLRSWK